MNEFKRGDLVETKTLGLVGEVVAVVVVGDRTLYRVLFKDRPTGHLPAESLKPASIVDEIGNLYRGPL